MKEKLLKEILREYDTYRTEQEQELRRREAEVLEKIPELTRYREKFVSTLADEARNIIKNDDNSNDSYDKEYAISFKEKEKELLLSHDYPADYLEPKYRCNKCKDTGFVGDLIQEKCSCLTQRLLSEIYKSSGITILKEQNFDTFDLSVFPNSKLENSDLTQREYMDNIRNKLYDYQALYPENSKKNLLFTGQTGLGKTFLLNCLAKAILDKGYTVLKITSYNLFENLFTSAFQNMQKSNLLKDRVFAVDTLIIDDLGTETRRNNFTNEQLFNILNERYLNKQHTFLSTNLGLTELTEKYSERVTSRIFDTSSTMIIRFIGQDIRLLPNTSTK